MELFDGKYKQEELLGTGAFSEVWKVTYVQTGVTLALKIYKPGTSMDNDGVKMLAHEYALMANLSHSNLLKPQFFDVCDGRPYLILPYCEKGNINKMVGKMSEEEAWKLLRDAASALEYLHSRKTPIIHQDIKPANILVADDGTYMLTDFGVSTSLKATLSRLSIDDQSLMSAGTLAYMDPMKFSRRNLPIMSNDIWSLGATVFEMLTGELPFGNSGGLLQKKGADVPDLPENFSTHLNDVLRSCLDEDPAKRPWASKLYDIAQDAIRHPETWNQRPTKESVIGDNPSNFDSIETQTKQEQKSISETQPLSEVDIYSISETILEPNQNLTNNGGHVLQPGTTPDEQGISWWYILAIVLVMLAAIALVFGLEII